MAKEVKEIKGGVGKFIAMTFIGLALFIVGLVLIILGGVLAGTSGKGEMTALSVIGIVIIACPAPILMGIGIPCWIAKGVKLKSLNKKK